MNATKRDESYALPCGPLGLLGPVDKPAPGTLPLRGDLAHIALAGTHLAAHYVIPRPARVRSERADMLCLPQEGAAPNCTLERGRMVEMLDVEGRWTWCCIGPEGPSGYVLSDSLEPDG